MKQNWGRRIFFICSTVATFKVFANTSNLLGIESLVNEHNLKHSVKITPSNVSSLYKSIISQGKNHPAALELSNILRTEESLKKLGVDPRSQENTLQSLVVLHALQDKMNSESPAFLYGVGFTKITEEILSRTRIQSEINNESVFSTDNSISLNKLRQRLADALAFNLAVERMDRLKNGSAEPKDFLGSFKPEIIKERVERFSAIKEMLVGDKKVNSSSFEKVLELEKLFSQSLVTNPSLNNPETIPLLKELVKNLARSPLNTSLNDEEKIVGQEILLKEIISMIQNREIKSPKELQNLVSISQAVKEKLLANLRFKDHFSNPNTFKSWLLSLVANRDLGQMTNSEERANAIVASAEKLIREEKDKLVINNKLPRSTLAPKHAP